MFLAGCGSKARVICPAGSVASKAAGCLWGRFSAPCGRAPRNAVARPGSGMGVADTQRQPAFGIKGDRLRVAEDFKAIRIRQVRQHRR